MNPGWNLILSDSLFAGQPHKLVDEFALCAAQAIVSHIRDTDVVPQTRRGAASATSSS
jgi:hypothetical protein